MAIEWIDPPELPALHGDERFTGTDATVHDFWRWAFSDFRLNTTRGILAEFLVATALGVDTSQARVEWDNYDVKIPNGPSIEVKASGTWQSWKQKGRSQPSFGGLISRKLVDETNEYTAEREVWADVYVFALHDCDSPSDYDPLDTTQWVFWVAPGSLIRSSGVRKAGLSWVRSNAVGPVPFTELRAAVATAHRP